MICMLWMQIVDISCIVIAAFDLSLFKLKNTPCSLIMKIMGKTTTEECQIL